MLALVLRLEELEPADLNSVPHMRAAIRLAINRTPKRTNSDDTQLINNRRQRARELDQRRILQGLFPRQIRDGDSQPLRKESISLIDSPLEKPSVELHKVEINPDPPLRELVASNPAPEVIMEHGGDDMGSGVRAHQLVTPIPINDATHHITLLEARHANLMGDLAAELADRDDRELLTTPDQDAGVMRLAAATRIERRPVQDDVLAISDAHHHRVKLPAIAVIHVQCAHHKTPLAEQKNKPPVYKRLELLELRRQTAALTSNEENEDDEDDDSGDDADKDRQPPGRERLLDQGLPASRRRERNR